jgi:site-specific recombinase XerD
LCIGKGAHIIFIIELIIHRKIFRFAAHKKVIYLMEQGNGERGNGMALYAMHLQSEGKEESTIRFYVAEAEAFLSRLDQGLDSLHRVTSQELLSFRDELAAGGMKRTTINKRMSMLRSFFRWAERIGKALPGVGEGLRLDESRKTEIRWLHETEERKLLTAVGGNEENRKNVRNAAIVSSMLYAGLRVEEVSLLRMDSVQPSNLLVYDGEGLTRKIPIDDRAYIPLLKWLRLRKELGKSKHRESPHLFVTERSGRMQPRAVQFVVESLCEKAGFSVTCQMLRHTYCRRLAEQGASMERLRAWAGHKSPLTTIQYFDALPEEGV